MAADALSPMRDLLERAGFRIRSANRADCVHCSGRSIRTVSYALELAHCFRCGWAANRVGLARQLGLLNDDPATLERLSTEARRRGAVEFTLAAFDRWREGRLRTLSDRYRVLGRQAALAQQVLRLWPNCEAAWDALARFYHSEAKLSRTLDWLTFTKASDWLERDSTPAEVFKAWRQLHAAA